MAFGSEKNKNNNGACYYCEKPMVAVPRTGFGQTSELKCSDPGCATNKLVVKTGFGN